VTEAAEDERGLSDFWHAVYAATPRTPVTQGIVVLNVAIFVALLFAGADLFKTSPGVLFAWGANYGPATLDDEPWRLGAYMFLHYGIVHLGFNMWALWDAGRLVERLYGNLAFAGIYAFAGVCGGLASLWWNEARAASAGASGAVFGVYGALFAFGLARKGAVPRAVIGSIGASAAVFVAFSLFVGALLTGIDNAAHLGGLAGGIVAGLALAHPIAAPIGVARMAATGALALAVLAGLWSALPPPPYTYRDQLAAERAIRAFLAEEAATVRLARDILDPLKRGELAPAAAASRLEAEVVPRWETAHRELAAVTLADAAPAAKRLQLMVRYTALRREMLSELAQGLRHDDRLRLEHANALAAESHRLLDELRRSQPESK